MLSFIPVAAVSVAFGQTMTTVGIPSDAFDYVASAQEKREWCWAAASQMILDWFDIEVKQADVVRRVKGELTDVAASEKDITASLNFVTKQRSGKKAIVRTISSAGPPRPSVIISELSHMHPILLAFNTGPRSGHTVVLTAATYFDTPKGPHISSVTIRDPYPTFSNMRNQGRVVVSGSGLRAFAYCIQRNWLVRVTTQGESYHDRKGSTITTPSDKQRFR